MGRSMLLAYCFHVFKALRYRVTGLVGRLMLRGLGVQYGAGLTLKGLPLVTRSPGSSIALGHDVMLISYSSDTSLAVNHAVKLETVAPGASIVLGDKVGMSGGTICAQRSVTVGARTMMGANVMIVDTDFHPLAATERWRASDKIQCAPVVIGENVFLGTGAMVLRGVHIGDNAVIGAASVVSQDVPANAIASGNPCRVLRFFNEEEIREIAAGAARS